MSARDEMEPGPRSTKTKDTGGPLDRPGALADTVAGSTLGAPERLPEALAATIMHSADDFCGSPPTSDPSTTRYELGRVFAAGGLGQIRRARDNHLDRTIAVKEIRGENTAPEHCARLVQEAKITASLEHPAIVPIHDLVITRHGRPFYCMKLITGRSLAVVLAEAVTIEQRIGLLPQILTVCDAIAYAHSKGIIHRDIKPSNVLLGSFGETIVIDWGLAKALESTDEGHVEATGGGAPEGALSLDALTHTGALLGTLQYMPPEQANAKSADRRADVYALGALLYHALTGAPPYHGDDGAQIYYKKMLAAPPIPPVPLSTAVDKVPPDLSAIVKKAMDLDPGLRYPSAQELAEDLRSFLSGQLVAAYTYTFRDVVRRWLHAHRTSLTLSLTALVVIAVVIAVSVRRLADEKRQAEVLRIDAERSAVRASDQSSALAARMSREDPTVAYLLMREIRHSEDTLGWFSAAASIWHEPISRAVFLGHRDRLRGGAFSPDGTLVATASFDGTARLWRADGIGNPAVLRGHTDHVHFANFSPDGRFLVTSSRDRTAIVWELDHLDAPVMLEGHTSIIWWAGFSPDGRWIATASKDATALLWDASPERLRSSPPPVPVVVFAGHTDQIWWAAFHPESTHLVTASKDQSARIWSVVEPDAAPLVLSDHQANVLRAHFNPNGTQVATIGKGEAVRLWALDGGTIKVIPTLSHDAAFSPDGAKLLTFHVRPQVWDTADGRLLAELGGGGLAPSIGTFGGNGGWIAVADDVTCIHVWPDLQSEVPARLCGLGSVVATIDASSDGTALVAGDESGRARLWEASTWSSAARIHKNDGSMRWSSEQQALLTVAIDGSTVVVHDVDNASLRFSAPAPVGDMFFDSVLAPAQGLLVTTTRGGALAGWDLAKGVRRWSVTGSPNTLVRALRADQALVAPLLGGMWRIIKLASGEAVGAPRAVSGTLGAVEVDPAGERVLTVTTDGVGSLWDLRTDEPPIELFRGGASTSPGVFRAGWIATAWIQDRLWVLDLHTGELLLDLWQQDGAITRAALSVSGHLLAFANLQGAVEVWSVPERRQVDVFTLSAVSMSFASNERWLALAESAGGRIVVRDVSLGQWLGEIDLVKGPYQVQFTSGADDLWVVGKNEGLFRLRLGTILSGGAEGLLNRPGRETSACLSMHQRQALVGETPLVAALGATACELVHGRTNLHLRGPEVEWRSILVDP